MREIKFRALGFYHEEGKEREFEYGYLSEETVCISTFENDKVLAINGIIVVKETVGQFTGLKDKNGIEIYEGDRLSADWEDRIGYVVWDLSGGYWKFETKTKVYDFTETDSTEFEIIGNIHQT